MAEDKKPKKVSVGSILAKDEKAPKAKSEPKGESKPKDGKKKKHQVHKMEVRRAGNGYITVHHAKDENGQMMEPQENPHTDLDTVHDALEEHMGGPNEGEEEAQEQPETTPSPAVSAPAQV